MNGFECLYLDLDSDQDYSLPNIYFTNRNFVLAIHIFTILSRVKNFVNC